MDLFEYTANKNLERMAPLADRMRPTTLEEYTGQDHIVGKGKLLYRAIKADKISSIILYGPPGTGKTTLAKIIANTTQMKFEQLNAVTSGIKDIREVIEKSKEKLGMYNERTILFIDEIHRFNKSQQDALLPYVENGTLILIGATTENPYFEVNKALISRSMIFKLEPLSNEDIKKVILTALDDKDKGLGSFNINIDPDALKHLTDISNGDARIALNGLELGVLTTDPNEKGIINITLDIIQECVQQRAIKYEKNGDEHYDTVSAFIKSMRGSDPDATLYWLAKMLYAGEDPKFIARRIIISASEDVGNADPQALSIATSAFDAVNFIGMPEGRIILAQAAVYIACAPKSNSSYVGIDKALNDIKNIQTGKVPAHLRDAHYSGSSNFGNGKGYLYPHNYEDGFIKQQYLPDNMVGAKYYEPTNNGYEKVIMERLKYIRE
ncbi:AAA ATPase, central domain protein [Gottschalkia acidurici 9a]|uniref:Replication-associated recombination protein A n=1 Tax=Gottschalkia acidurici (strain ATCC 7906 / DSM 604 / BCRC 14475 / CIP 104303 / KCTC 5404 / NCIMB 10678 / 9a) TaxID=1128398 RepID=K0AWZ1_GOTA9|nr:AAA family ATPase [Gottschalkia acidurici]AFS78328.1 AAA ATPase, central domain protein [Gottschalkia acidurici 9a]